MTELAESLYDFLPASFSSVTWPDIASRLDVRNLWPEGSSKRQSIPLFLRNVLEHRRDRFSDLIIALVQEGLNYKSRKGNPVTRQEIERINQGLQKLQLKIPELNDAKFLNSLQSGVRPQHSASPQPTSVPDSEIDLLKAQFLALCSEQDKKRRGFAFEAFLNEFFSRHALDSRRSFRIEGEQIDGSFEWQGDTFLVEARWRSSPANAADLLVLRGKAEKSEWTRGLFISINGFSNLSIPTLQIGRRANLIAMSGQDLILILERRWTLFDALKAKLRHTGETAEAYKPLAEFI